MKQSRFLLIFTFVVIAVVVFGATLGDTQAGTAHKSEPNASAGIIPFQYAMNDGNSGTGTYYLSDNSTFVDDSGATGVWSFNPANNWYAVYYNSGAYCGAFSIGQYNPNTGQIQGLRFCTDGSGIQGYWLGFLSAGVTTRVSVASDGTQGNAESFTSVVSADGRYVAFSSDASNLISGDTNNHFDIFVHDRLTEQTTRVSVASDGTQGNGESGDPAISADGRYVAFGSGASNLVSGDTNVWPDIFVHDRETGQTSRVSVASDGTQGNYASENSAISADGRYVTFGSNATNLVGGDTNDDEDVFVHDRLTGQTNRVSITSEGAQGNDNSHDPAISADGRYVAFESWANNLVSGDTNNHFDIFVHDRQTGQTSRVSVASDGTQGNEASLRSAISADGRFVAFESIASSLVSGDTNGRDDIFVHDRQTGQTTRVSVASDGAQGNGNSDVSALSADGRYVAFESGASNLVGDDTNGRRDIFVHDQQTGQTSRVSLASAGTQGNASSRFPVISADGRYVAFGSGATNLVSGDTNGETDVFVHDRGP